MPLTKESGSIAFGLKHLSNRDLADSQPAGVSGQYTKPKRISPRRQLRRVRGEFSGHSSSRGETRACEQWAPQTNLRLRLCCFQLCQSGIEFIRTLCWRNGPGSPKSAQNLSGRAFVFYPAKVLSHAAVGLRGRMTADAQIVLGDARRRGNQWGIRSKL